MSSSAGFRPGMASRRPREDDDDHTSGGGGRPSKRQCLEEFERGSVIRVVVRNFMTYVSATIDVGARLNLVLGPNGTGKSSLVCALCVGLAGATRLLGRADDLSEYVRRGESEGSVEITLSSGDPRKPIVVSRRIFTKDNSSEWKLNGRPSKMNEVKALIKDLNIQLDNLCQFLPQDRVSYFAQLAPGALLVETEKAIGDSTLHDLHMELISGGHELRELEMSVGAVQARLEGLERENEANRRDRDRFTAREALLQKVKVCKAKVAWVAFQTARDKFITAKARAEEATKAHQEKNAELQRQKAPLEGARKREQELRQEANKCLDKLKKMDIEIHKLLDGDKDKLKNAIEEKQDQISKMVEDAAKREEDIAKYRGLIEHYQAELDTLPTSQASRPDTSAQQTELRQQISTLDQEIRRLGFAMEDCNGRMDVDNGRVRDLEGQLKQIDNKKWQRFQKLEKTNRGITNFTEAVQKGAGGFRGHVYGPLLLEINVQDPAHAAYLEGTCRNNLFSRFVTEYPEDQEQLMEMGEHFHPKFHPIVSCFKGNVNAPIQHRCGPASQFARYGITHTLDEVFDAPPIVKHVFNDEAAVGQIYIGSETTNVEQFFSEQREVKTLWVPDAQHRVVTSLYNRNLRSSTVIPKKDAWLLSDSGGDTEQQRAAVVHERDLVRERLALAEGELRNIKAHIAGAQGARSQADQDLKALINEAQAANRRRTNAQRQLNINKRMLALEEKKADPLQGREKAEGELKALHTKLQKLILSLPAKLRVFWDLQKSHFVQHIQAQELALQITAAGKLDVAHKLELCRLQAAAADADKQEKHFRDMARLLREDALQTTDGVNMSNASTSTDPDVEEWSKKFKPLPSSKADLDEEIDRAQAEAEGIVCANPRVMEEYKRRQEEIRKLQLELTTEGDSLSLAKASLEEKRARWEPELRRIVDVINRSFGANMAEMGCAGSVELHAEDADFSRWALKVRVKFRDAEELQLLTANRQSGGERSVATILYLIAIQAVTACPFRVVDEINQGMDPINERKVFQQLVEAACRQGTPQCFLLTPKLLPNLPFTRHVKVLQIMNGPLIKDVATTFREEKIWGNRPFTRYIPSAA